MFDSNNNFAKQKTTRKIRCLLIIYSKDRLRQKAHAENVIGNRNF